MDHITQLKNIRADAIARMRNSPDFKLAGKLGLLIVELGETVDDEVDFEDTDEPAAYTATESTFETPRPFESSFAKSNQDEFLDISSDEMIDELVAEMEGDAAELDAILAEETDTESKTIGPFLKTDAAEDQYSNGSTH